MKPQCNFVLLDKGIFAIKLVHRSSASKNSGPKKGDKARQSKWTEKPLTYGKSYFAVYMYVTLTNPLF